ncbi:hypothetical protein ACF068_25620 [Streptomyces sp. NPDC016309]|uniref:hypothetical protein n=1 Tax=Streptomyces sp. NPDC016309 TaxID=3364965 RepID=UPI0036FC99AB
MMISAPAPPTLFGVSVAVLALAVSLLSFSVALGALGWQMAKHRLDGGRPKVYLNSAIWEPGQKLIVNRSGKWELKNGNLGHIGLENIELAQLVVENPGRTAITIYTPGIAVVGTKNRDYTISPRLFPLEGYGADNASSENSLRLEPYDRVTFLLDYWAIVPRLLREANNGRVTLRGCISVAGRSRLQKSPKRLAWKVTDTAWTARKDARSISPFTVIWRVLFKDNMRAATDSDGDTYPAYTLGAIVRTAMQKFGDRPEVDAFVAELERADNLYGSVSFQYHSLTFAMDEALDRYGVHLSAWSTGPAGGRAAHGEADQSP